MVDFISPSPYPPPIEGREIDLSLCIPLSPASGGMERGIDTILFVK
jgi:hypothetical protein